jgi:hypothetical protein
VNWKGYQRGNAASFELRAELVEQIDLRQYEAYGDAFDVAGSGDSMGQAELTKART